MKAKMLKVSVLLALGLALATAATAQTAGPTVTTIAGNPLTIYVGSDASLQVVDAANPGDGQFFPTASPPNTADAGWLVSVLAVGAGFSLFGPDFSNHPAGTAAGSLGLATTYLPYTSGTVSPVSGSGTASDPYTVTAHVNLDPDGLVSGTLVVSYINGEHSYSQTFTVTNNDSASQDLRIFDAGDIYLEGNDTGIPYLQPDSGSVGGQNCPGTGGAYTILLIPATPADALTAEDFDTVWHEIGVDGQLDNIVAATTGAPPTPNCIDNGAALQWNRTLATGASSQIRVTSSYGSIPTIASFNVTEVTPASGAQGSTVPVTISGIGFGTSTSFDFGPGITVSTPTVTGPTTATATLAIAPGATVGSRDLTASQPTTSTPSGTESATLPNGFSVLAAGGLSNVQFTAPAVTVAESTGNVLLTVSRVASGSSTAPPASVQYATANGTAQAPGDFTATSDTLNWGAGDTSPKTVSIPIIDDGLAEPDESFTVALSNPAGVTLASPDTETVTIVHNDGFGGSSSGGSSSGGSSSGGSSSGGSSSGGSSSGGGPIELGRIPDQVVVLGVPKTLNLSPYFRDPDGEPIIYNVISSDTSVLSVSVRGSILTMTAHKLGHVKLGIAAGDSTHPPGSATPLYVTFSASSSASAGAAGVTTGGGGAVSPLLWLLGLMALGWRGLRSPSRRNRLR